MARGAAGKVQLVGSPSQEGILVASPPVVYEQTEWVDAETAEREP